MKHFICLILSILTAGLFIPIWIALSIHWSSSKPSDYTGPVYHDPPPLKPKKPYKPRPDIHTSYKAELHTNIVNYDPPITRLTLPRMFYVYQYISAIDHEIIYVGKGSKGRFANYNDRYSNIKTLWDSGNLHVQILAENFISSKEAEKYEKKIIKDYISSGYNLSNKVHNPRK